MMLYHQVVYHYEIEGVEKSKHFTYSILYLHGNLDKEHMID